MHDSSFFMFRLKVIYNWGNNHLIKNNFTQSYTKMLVPIQIIRS